MRALLSDFVCVSVVIAVLSSCADPAAPGSQKGLVDDPVEGPGGETDPDVVPVRAVAFVTPVETAAGEAATVRCELHDPDGNYTYIVDPAFGVTIAGVEVIGNTPGERKVTCTFDAAPSLAQIPATWTVKPGAGVALDLFADPVKDAYSPGEKITITAHLLDDQGNVLEENTELLSVLAEPKVGFSVTDNVVSFDEGATFVVTGESKVAAGVSGSIELLVDASPPVITLDSPPRGVSSAESSLPVSGTVSDDRAVMRVLVNGEEVALDAEGAFSASWPLGYGLSTLIVSAEDEAGNVSTTYRAAGWSSERYAMDPPKLDEDAVANALQITLTQDGMDDVAQLLTAVLAGLDLAALLGAEPLGSFLGCDYHLTKLDYEDPQIGVTLEQGQLKVVVVLKYLKIRIKNSGPFFCTLNDEATLGTGPLVFDADKMTVLATVKFNVTKDEPGIEVTVDDVDFENMWGIDIPVIQDIVDWAIETFVALISPLIENLLNDAFTGLIADFAINQDIPLPNLGGGDPYVISLETRLASIAVSPESMRVALDGMAGAADPIRPYANHGAMSYAGCGPTESLPIEPLDPMLVALHDDLVNHILFGVWDSGMLMGEVDPSALGSGESLDLESMGITDLKVLLDPKLPLFLNTCSGGIELQLGDLLLDVEMNFSGNPTHLKIWLEGAVPIALQVVENAETGATELGFELGELDGLFMEVVLNEGFFEGNDGALVTLIKSALIPMIIDGLGNGVASFPLPEIDLSGVIDGVPEGTKIGLDIEKLTTQGGTIRLLGALTPPE